MFKLFIISARKIFARQNALPYLIAGVVAILYVVWAASFIYKSSFVVVTGERIFSLFDDAMISMRYGWNLAHGQGLVWNPSERVEGFTNLGMTLCMACASLFFSKSAAVLAIQIFGAAVMLALAFICATIGRTALHTDESRSNRWIVPVFFCTGLAFYPLHYWTLMGMENGLQAVFLYAGILFALAREKDARFSPSIPIFLALAYITRPDSAVPAACIMVFRLVGIIRRPGGLKSVFKETAVLAAAVIAVSVFRYSYYGEWMPNTYTLKVTGHPLAVRTLSGFRYVKLFWWNRNFIVVGAALLGCFVRPTGFKFLLLSILIATSTYQIYVGGDAFAHFRMQAHYIPALLLLLLLGMTDIAERFGAFRRIHLLKSVTILFVFLCAFYLLNTDYLAELSFKKRALDVGNNRRHADLAFRLNEVLTQDAAIAVFYAGTIPYYVDSKAIDLLGKSDKHVARAPIYLPDMSIPMKRYAPGHTKYDLKYSIKKLQPTYTAGLAWRNQSVAKWGKKHYTLYNYKGIKMWIRNGDPAVRWKQLKEHDRKKALRRIRAESQNPRFSKNALQGFIN